MDGGGRLLRSLTEAAQGLIGQARPRFAGLPDDFDAAPVRPPFVARRPRRAAAHFSLRVAPRGTRGGLGVALTLALFAATGLYGSIRGGQYADFVKLNGSPADLVAKAIGFPIDAITIAGIKELNQHEILEAAAIDPTHSLLLLDAAQVRDRLKAMPLVRDAVVTKLFPDRLTIKVDERDPVAIWQLNGKLFIVSSDGVVIDAVEDDRFAGLPFVVGDHANDKVGDFLKLLDQTGDLRARIVSGMLVEQRRWSLKMDNGVEVKLPETDAGTAIAELVDLQKQSRLIDKDVVSIDLRVPGRVTARLSDDAAAARAAVLAKKPKSGDNPL